MKRVKGKFAEEITDAVLYQFYWDYQEKDRAREEALKRGWSLARLVRYAVKAFVETLTKEIK